MFFVLAFVITWLILRPGVAANLGCIDFQLDVTVLTILGSLGPLLAAMIVKFMTEGWEGIKEIFQSALVGNPEDQKTYYLFLASWGLVAAATMVMAISALTTSR
jgi:hypothetical protein